MSKVVKGRIISVENKDRAFGSANQYLAIQVEDADGSNERCLLFTEAQIAEAQERADKNKEDLTTKGFFTDLID